jgi:hypothetical protein
MKLCRFHVSETPTAKLLEVQLLAQSQAICKQVETSDMIDSKLTDMNSDSGGERHGSYLYFSRLIRLLLRWF